MNIGLLSLASKDSGGVYQYTYSLLEAFLHISNKYNVIQIRYPEFPKILENDILIDSIKSNSLLKIARAIHGITGIQIGELVSKEITVNLSHIDLFISPIISLFPFHLSKPYTVTIHDFQQEYYPEFFTFKERITRKIVYRTAKYAKMVIVESNFVKKDLVKFLGIDEARIKVLPSPPPNYLRDIKFNEELILFIRNKYKLPNEFIFYPAQFWYHKNHLKLLEALKIIKMKFSLDVPLILVGSKKNNFEKVMKKIEELELENSVHYLGYVPDEDMPYIYKLSTALVMPTLFESLSLPIWEAFYLGVPVVSSNVCALPEQVGDAGLLFDPLNPTDIAEKIYMVWSDLNLRQNLIQKGYERVKNLTIENYAKQWEEILKEI